MLVKLTEEVRLYMAMGESWHTTRTRLRRSRRRPACVSLDEATRSSSLVALTPATLPVLCPKAE